MKEISKSVTKMYFDVYLEHENSVRNRISIEIPEFEVTTYKHFSFFIQDTQFRVFIHLQ